MDGWNVSVTFQGGVTWRGFRTNFYDQESVPAALVAEARETYPGEGDVIAIRYIG